MKSGKHILSWFSMLLLFCLAVNAQQTSSSAGSATVPRLVNFSGKATDLQGKAASGIAGATFAIYKDQYDGAPLCVCVTGEITRVRGIPHIVTSKPSQVKFPSDEKK